MFSFSKTSITGVSPGVTVFLKTSKTGIGPSCDALTHHLKQGRDADKPFDEIDIEVYTFTDLWEYFTRYFTTGYTHRIPSENNISKDKKLIMNNVGNS